MADANQKKEKRFRFGLMGKLSLFMALMLIPLIGTILAVSLKQQEGSIWKTSMAELDARLDPVRNATREIQHTTRNFIRLRELELRIEKKFRPLKKLKEEEYDVAIKLYYNKYFDEEFLNNAVNKQRAQLATRSGVEIEDRTIKTLRLNASRVHTALQKVKPDSMPADIKKVYRGGAPRSMANTGRELRKIFDYQSAMRGAFQGFDLSKYRVETVNLNYKDVHFDTYYLQPWKTLNARIAAAKRDLRAVNRREDPEKYVAVRNALRNLMALRARQGKISFRRINSRKILTNKELLQGFDRVTEAFYNRAPLTQPVRSEYFDKSVGANYVCASFTIFHNQAVSNRATLVKETLSSPEYSHVGRFWKPYLAQEKPIQEELRVLAAGIQKRLEELKQEEKPTPPYRDKTFAIHYANYKKVLKKRGELFESYAKSFLERSQFAVKKLKGRLDLEKPEQKKLSDQYDNLKKEFKTVSKTKEPERYKTLKANLEDLKIRVDSGKILLADLKARIDNYFDKNYEIVDAFRNLREVALQDRMVLSFAYDKEAYNGYIQFPKNRKTAAKNWGRIRKWIAAGCSETVSCNVGKARYGVRYPVGTGVLVMTRSESEAEMWRLDTEPLDKMADRLLYENTAGFTRVFFDQSDVVAGIRRERGVLTDTAISIGFRMIFMAFILSFFLVRTIKSIIAGARRVGQGELDVRFDHTSRDELGDLAGSLNHMVEGLKEREELRGELTAAEEIQRQLLPFDMPGNMKNRLSFGHFYKAMSGVGGDYYDFIESDKNRMFFCIADVSNHGVGPAIVMTLMRAQLHGIIRRGVTDPAEVLSELNERLYRETPSNIFVTIFAGFYDRSKHEITYCSAGHNRAYVYIYEHERLDNLEAGGMPLGAVDNDIFSGLLQTRKLKLAAGDLFFQYTDGVNEAMDSRHLQFGYERLEQVLKTLGKKKPEIIVVRIAEVVEKFAGKKIFCEGPSQLNDDIAMIAFRRIQ